VGLHDIHQADADLHIETSGGCLFVITTFLLHLAALHAERDVQHAYIIHARRLILKDLAERGGFEPPLGCLFPKTV
jgi:hypothetical protein